MSITSDQEREFYDRRYAQFLNLPDPALVCTRQTIESDLNNPAHPIYERRRLYLQILEVLLAEPVAGTVVLDYGCGTGDWGLVLAGEGARVTFVDLSPAAIELIARRAAATGIAARTRGCARDASDLSCFADGEFDLIYGSAAVHHTLKYPNALAELLRVLRPGGRLVLAETYGNNKLLNLARRCRWKLSAEPEEAGEEIILDDSHIALLRAHMREVRVMPLNLLAMGKRLLRGRFSHPAARRALALLESADHALLKLCPPLRRYCGEVVIEARK